MNTKIVKVAIVGFGSMGKQIYQLANDNNLNITEIFDIDNKINVNKKYDFNVAIDFTEPSSVLENIKILAKLEKDIVIGTTGWNDKLNEVTTLVKKSGIGLVYGSNFSIGMQMFFRIVSAASGMLNKTEGYDIMLHEIHHKKKKDSPSGTALSLAKLILQDVKNKKKIETEKLNESINNEVLHVSSTRGGEIAGTHTIYIDSIADTIELTHRAKNRTGFALGAIQAAKWIKGRKGIFNFNDVTEIWFNS